MDETEPVETEPVDWKCKLLIIGDSAVGKTSLMQRFTRNEFSDSYVTTLGIGYMYRTLKIQGKVVKVEIWDTAGQERFLSIPTTYHRGANCVLVVYDITKHQSFENVESWISRLQTWGSGDIEKMILGNKCDMESQRKVQKKDGKDLAKKYGVEFSETSAKTNVNVESAVNKLLSRVVAKYVAQKAQKEEKNVRLAKRGESAQKSTWKCWKWKS